MYKGEWQYLKLQTSAVIPTVKTYHIVSIIKRQILVYYKKKANYLNSYSDSFAVRMRWIWWYFIQYFTGMSISYVSQLTTGHSHQAVLDGLIKISRIYAKDEKFHVDIDVLAFRIATRIKQEGLGYTSIFFNGKEKVQSKM